MRALLATGKVYLEDAPTGDGGRLIDPARVRVKPRAPRCSPGRDLVVLWHDAQLAVVWKPSGLLSVPAPGRSDDDNALARVGRILGSALPVHRLDEGTSGLMAVALRPQAQEAMKALLEQHAVERRYLALVRGHVPDGSRRIRNELVRDRGDGLRGSRDRMAPNRPPQPSVSAETTLTTLERLRGASLVEAQLATGRTHQVRIHCAELGHPVLGDPLYGPRSPNPPRLALHAAVLAFEHPLTREPLRFVAPLADDLERLRRELVLAPGGAPGNEKTRWAARPTGREEGRTRGPSAWVSSVTHFANGLRGERTRLDERCARL